MLAFSRRALMSQIAALPLFCIALKAKVFADDKTNPEKSPLLIADNYPTQSPELTREVVTVAHFDIERLKELVEARPSMAKAAWDWGFGDWETALGAASHMGNRPIAEYLISKGARPSIFSAAMLGQLEVVKAFVQAQPHVQAIAGPHSISLLSHAKAGGKESKPVFDYLMSVGGADATPQHPLDNSESQDFVGTYTFGVGTSQKIVVSFENGHLNWTRVGAMPHILFYLGAGEFYPAGAPAVRIRFERKADRSVMTVHDPVPVLTAECRRS